MRRVAFIGYGELAHALAGGLTEAGVDLQAYVRPRSDPPAEHSRRERMRAHGVRCCGGLEEALAGADLVIAAVPGRSTLDVVRASTQHLGPGQLYVDPASALPDVKRAAATLVENTGCQYADVAIIGTVVTSGPRVPMLAAGSGAVRWRDEGSAVGLNVALIDGPAGAAAVVKLLRSVFMKGRDALVLEMLLAARQHGVEDDVLASLDADGQASFSSMAERVICSLAIYAERRADELADAAHLVREAGVDPVMTEAGEHRLRALARSGLREHFGGERPQGASAVWDALAALVGRVS